MEYPDLDLKNIALITIDTQTDTLEGQPLEIPGTSAVLPNMASLLKIFRDLKLPIIHIVRIYLQDGSNAELCRKKALEEGQEILIKNSKGSQIAKELFDEKVMLDPDLLMNNKIQKINDDEVVIYKPRWGAFYKTPLEKYLNDKGISSLIFTGCNYPNCPRTTIYEASERDYRIALIKDGVSGLYEKGEKEMENIGVNLLLTKEMINKMICTIPEG
ncbi:cysteine hydrolase family protein [Eudoraea chungangensis]|uniref:cysteine hydrolase family protein n=1 Tax=Eudoraea chungangensis TaxID=1481905 RepID=UPI0023EB5AD6|nr:cysteine hydrolase [Eudoraea chungangensis]